jgi:riboflavin transport system substrate-binding protein
MLIVLTFSACFGDRNKQQAKNLENFNMAVFVPGMIQGSPTYEMLVEGARLALAQLQAEGRKVSLKIIEAGFSQSSWQDGIMALASTGSYQLIVTSNPSMPEYCINAAKAFERQRFLIMDAELEGHSQIHTVSFDHFQQAWLNGHFAALVTASGLPHAKPGHKIGLLAGQEYPVMNKDIRSGFLAGAQFAQPDTEIDFRILGNWYDATRAQIIAREMYQSGVDIILSIAGGANQGVISAAKDYPAYVLWFDSPGYHHAPGVVVGSSTVAMTQATLEAIKKIANGHNNLGTPTYLGIQEGYISFDLTHPDFVNHVPQHLIDQQLAILKRIKDGTLKPQRP